MRLRLGGVLREGLGAWRSREGGTRGLEEQGGRGLEELRWRTKGPGGAVIRSSEGGTRGMEEQNERD